MAERKYVKPWLVQRFSQPKEMRTDRRGVDRHFSFDYMGAAEFEFGALKNALDEMRYVCNECEAYVIKRMKLPTGEVAWFFGLEELFEQAKDFFEDQLTKKEWHLKERSDMRRAYNREETNSFDIIGWWAIDAQSPWVLTMKKAQAKLWEKEIKR